MGPSLALADAEKPILIWIGPVWQQADPLNQTGAYRASRQDIKARVDFPRSLSIVINDFGESIGLFHRLHLKLNKKIRPSGFNNRRREEGADRWTTASDWKVSGSRL